MSIQSSLSTMTPFFAVQRPLPNLQNECIETAKNLIGKTAQDVQGTTNRLLDKVKDLQPDEILTLHKIIQNSVEERVKTIEQKAKQEIQRRPFFWGNWLFNGAHIAVVCGAITGSVALKKQFNISPLVLIVSTIAYGILHIKSILTNLATKEIFKLKQELEALLLKDQIRQLGNSFSDKLIDAYANKAGSELDKARLLIGNLNEQNGVLRAERQISQLNFTQHLPTARDLISPNADHLSRQEDEAAAPADQTASSDTSGSPESEKSRLRSHQILTDSERGLSGLEEEASSPGKSILRSPLSDRSGLVEIERAVSPQWPNLEIDEIALPLKDTFSQQINTDSVQKELLKRDSALAEEKSPLSNPIDQSDDKSQSLQNPLSKFGAKVRRNTVFDFSDELPDVQTAASSLKNYTLNRR